MMGYNHICLLLLLSGYTLAQDSYDDNDPVPSCLLASRFKANRKYVYQYSTESSNGVVGTASLRNGPKVSCQVEIEVPQVCIFIMHTRDCVVGEVSATDPQGQRVYRRATGSEAFRAAMEKNPLKVSVETVTSVLLYPKEDEPVNILNIKRGIVSALILPVMDDHQDSVVGTVHGECLTSHLVNDRRDIPVDVTLTRDLSQCDQFTSRKLANSPLALLQKLHQPMSKLIKSAQDCNYKFDNKGKHITAATCTEKHLYRPFSYKDNGISSVVTQELIFQNSNRINNIVFKVNPSQSRPLHFEDPEDKAPVQTKDAVLSTMNELMALAGTDRGQRRTGLFHKLVSDLRGLRNETLSEMVPDMWDKSGWLMWQALIQCGTPECTSAALQAIRTVDGAPLETDALVYALSLRDEPDEALVRDLLTMAEFRQSKAIMYALANTVEKIFKGEMTPVLGDVADLIEFQLYECAEKTLDKKLENPPDPCHEISFLNLRAFGVMGRAMQKNSPVLVSYILSYARKKDIPLLNQKAAIQAFRLMDVNHEVKVAFKQIYYDQQSPTEKRIAAYLILMKNPDQKFLREMVKLLEYETDDQLKRFVFSHLDNIRKSTEPQMQRLRDYIEVTLRDQPPQPRDRPFDRMSRNYKMDSPLGSVQSNIIYDGIETLPKEVMLETTLKVFDHDYDILEVGLEGTGFEPTVEALFADKGFFPDSILKIIYWLGEKIPRLGQALDRLANRDRMKRQAPQNLLKDIIDNLRKLFNDVRLSPTPEAVSYLKLLGKEMGHMKTSEIRQVLETLYRYYQVFGKELPMKALRRLTSSTDNEVFAHYIFMENTFALPTASGFPLKFSMSGVFAPGAKGGMTHSRSGSDNIAQLSFMPSVGLEFITEMGIHIPDFVDAEVEMHTNMYHECSLNPKITIDSNQIRVSIPAPKSNTQIFSISNELLSVSSGQATVVPPLMEDRTDSKDCQPFFSGLRLCTIMRYSSARSVDEAPYYPLTGESRFAVELEPTGEVSEYTATISEKTLRDGRRGRHKVETMKLHMKAEGDDSSEASVTVKYNRNKQTVTADVVIPDFDVEAGVKLAVADSDAKGKKMRGITIDVTNKDIPRLTLSGRMSHHMMKEAMVQLQLVVPSLNTDASITATLKKENDVMISDLETAVLLPETSYQHKASLKYDDEKIELELKTDLNSEIKKLIPDLEDHHRHLQQLIDQLLDQRVAKTDMKLRHIVSKGIEAANIWLDKLTAHIPGLAKLRSKRSISDLTLPPLPEKLFLESDSFFRYQVSKDRMAISLPLPLGGKTSKELNFPMTLSSPPVDIPEINLHIPSKKVQLPSFTIPPTLDFVVPLLGLAEASTKINSNLYSWEGSFAGGNNTVDTPNYIVQYKAIAQSPIHLLSYKLEGTGMMSGRADDNLKYLLNCSLSHSLLDTSFSIVETLQVTDKFNARANYKMEASCPLGLEASLYYSAQSMSTLDSDEVSGDGTVDGSLTIGPYKTNTSYTNSYILRPHDREGRGESTLVFNSPFLQLDNMILGKYANSELNILSKTNVQKDVLKHIAELKYKDKQLILKCNAVATAMDKVLNNKVEVGVSDRMAVLRVESQLDDNMNNRAYSLISGSLDSNGLEVNSEGSLILQSGRRGLHKASVVIGRNGFATSGTNNIQCSPVTFENVFSAAIDMNGAAISTTTKAMADESRGELNIDGKITADEATLYGTLKGHAHDATTRNNLNIVLNPRALTVTSNTMGAMKQMSTESSNTLTLTLWTLALKSKTNNYYCEDFYYKQDTKVDMKPFVLKFDMKNDLKFYDLSLNNENHVKLEPVKVDLSGSVMGAYRNDHYLKHSYDLGYDNMAGGVKCSTSGNVMDTLLSHNCYLEFAGLSSKSHCEAQINSDNFRFDGAVRTMALPFSFTLNSLVNSEGEINLNGKHTGQVYSKLLVKAEPLALAYSHDSRVSTTHKLPNGDSSTNVENNCESLLTPVEQAVNWKLKSNLNNHNYNQDVSAYNNPEKIGFEFSGMMLTDLFSKLSRNKRSIPELQEYSVSSFLKYDKNTDCHIIQIPFIESLPEAFEVLKTKLVQALESLQRFINNLNIDQLISDFRARMDRLPGQVRSFMRKMDLENKVNRAKAKLDRFMNDYAWTMDDLEVAVKNLRKKLENGLTDIVAKIKDLLMRAEDYVRAGHLEDKITDVLSKIGSQLMAFNDKYGIKQSIVKLLDAMVDIIRQIDLQKLTERSAEWLRELDSKYGLLDKMRDKLSELKQVIENFDIKMFLQDVKDYLLSFDLATYLQQLSSKIPSMEIGKVLESMNDVIVNWIDEYEIPNKINSVYYYVRDLLLKYNLDDTFKELMDQVVVLIKGLNIDKTVQSVVDALKSINFESAYDKIIQLVDSVTNKLREIDYKKSIDDLNERISSFIKSIKEFDYDDFVDKTNEKIAELTDSFNEQLKKYEIVEKIEAIRVFFREIQTSIHNYLNELKNTKVADALKKLKNVIDTTFYNDIKLKIKDMLEDVRQRILAMDIRDEMYIYLSRASESYTNMVAFITAQFNRLIEKIRELAEDNKVINQIKQVVDRVMEELRRAEIEVPTFAVPFTDLVIPAFTINLNKLHEIKIPAQISIPEFTILNTYTIPAFTIDFEEMKAKIVALIEDLKEYEIQTPDPEEIFGDLKVLYLSDLPDLTFPEITLSEVRFPAINVPKLNFNDFEITMLPIPEIKLPEVPYDICIPVFGKIHGEFRLNSPHYNLVSTGKIENSTSTPRSPQFTATFTSDAKSPIQPLEYTFEATAQLEAPRMKKLLFTKKLKATHMAFSIDHDGSLTLSGSSAETSSKTTAIVTTPIYNADLVNSMSLTLNSGISATMDTTYKHNLNFPSMEISSQASVTHNLGATMEPGRITVTGLTVGNGKWNIQDYSDEGTHKSNIDFDIQYSTAKLTFVGETDCKALKRKEMMTVESVILRHITVDARIESEVPSLKKSLTVLNGEANIGDLRVALKASHDAEHTGMLTGSTSNTLEFLAHPFEITLDVKNKLNSKIFLPMKLIGKVDLQNDYCLLLTVEKQRACWITLARFNQYRYNHNFTAENNEMEIFTHLTASGEANLDFLTVPLSIPSMHLPYLNTETPEVTDFSLWEDAGFKTLLITPQQSFDLNMNLNYYKNKDEHILEIQLQPIYNAIRDNGNIVRYQFEKCRDKVIEFLKDSYNRARSKYIKHRIETSSLPPRIFTVPRYKIPILNIQVSAFRAEMPAFSYFVPKEVSTPSFKVPALGFSVPSYTLVLPSLEFPVIHVPDTLGELQLPTFTLPDMQNTIAIPAMGNITFDLSFKSPMITLTSNAGVYNQPDIVARFGAVSTSVFDVLNGKMDGTSSLTRKRGIKLATTVSLEHPNLEANHECAVSLTKRSVEGSVVNTAKLNLPFLNLELNQELNGNTKTKPNVVSAKKLKYMFNIPQIESIGKGNLDMNWALEAPLTYISFDTNTLGKSDVTIMDTWNLSGDLENVGNFFMNINNLRSTVRTALKSAVDKQEKRKRRSDNELFHFDLNKNLELEVSLRRLFATVDYRSNNKLNSRSFQTAGSRIVKGELDVVPLKSFKTTLNIGVNQPSSLAPAALFAKINVAVSPEKQSVTWSKKEELGYFIHNCDFLLSNDESEIRMDLTESVEGHLAFLKSIKLPVYQKTVWDVLKFDQVTNMDDLQVLKCSSSIVYTKSMDGLEYAIPFRPFENGITFSIPEISIAVPSWVKKIPQSLSKIDMRFENTKVPDRLSFPPVITVPSFNVPFTNLHFEPYKIDPKMVDILRVITTKEFDIMLPGLPKISVPSYDVDTWYQQGKMSFLSFHIPYYEVTVSPFTLPKSFGIGEYTVDLDQIMSQISNFELPTVIIPEQKIEIPETVLHLPVSVFFPVFGALSATVKVSSPIYNVSTTANVERKDSSLETTLTSLCTSTMIFLEYDLSATATLSLDEAINFIGKGNLIHSDANVDWHHVFTQNLRMKRQAPVADPMMSRHTLNVDITSQTFVDVSFRFASRKDGITASISSPSSGFLGLQFQRRSSSQVYGKLFSRYLSTPGQDTDVLTAKATLRNPQKLLVQTTWNPDFFDDVVEGTVDKIPAMTDAVLKFINKYHTAHFGFDLNRGSMKLKNSISNFIERAYHEVPLSFDNLQNSVRDFFDRVKDKFQEVSDRLMSTNMQNVRNKLTQEAGRGLRAIEGKILDFLDAIERFLSNIRLPVPGSEEGVSGLEMLRRARRSLSRVADEARERFSNMLEKISSDIREFRDNGNEVMHKAVSSMKSAVDEFGRFIRKLFEFLNRTANNFIEVFSEKAQDFINFLNEVNMKIAPRLDATFADVLQFFERLTEDAKRFVVEYKDLTKQRIQEVYNSLNVDSVNDNMKELISGVSSHIKTGVNRCIELIRRMSNNTPYITVSNNQMDIEIPLP